MMKILATKDIKTNLYSQKVARWIDKLKNRLKLQNSKNPQHNIGLYIPIFSQYIMKVHIT